MNDTTDDPWLGPKYLPIMVTAVGTVPDVGESAMMIGEGRGGIMAA